MIAFPKIVMIEIHLHLESTKSETLYRIYPSQHPFAFPAMEPHEPSQDDTQETLTPYNRAELAQLEVFDNCHIFLTSAKRSSGKNTWKYMCLLTLSLKTIINRLVKRCTTMCFLCF